MVAEAAARFIEGVLPKELAGAARGRDPLRFAKDFPRAREASDGEPIERHHDLVIACRLRPEIADLKQLGPQWGELGHSALKVRSTLL